jgi:hypothetical protein
VEPTTRGLPHGEESDAILARLFAGALGRRFGRADAAGNLYLAPFEVPQIRLFELVAQAVPSVTTAVAKATQILVDLCAGGEGSTLVDVGIGDGRQIARVLRALGASEAAPRRVTVVGIEPSAESLRGAAANVLAAGRDAGIAVDFEPWCCTAESLSAADWRRIAAAGPRAVVNASFALHHVRDVPGHDARDALLRDVAAARPAAIVLTEPDVDHREPDLPRRLHNCWTHFRQTFRMVSRAPIDVVEKHAVMTQFFGREIDDILGAPDDERCERHETLASWEARLGRAGFRTAVAVHVVEDGVPLTGVLVGRPAA